MTSHRCAQWLLALMMLLAAAMPIAAAEKARAPLARPAYTFEVQIGRMKFDQSLVSSVRIGDAYTRVVTSGTYNGKQGVVPVGVTYGDLLLSMRDATLLARWLSRPTPQVVDVSVLSGGVRVTYRLHDVVPLRMRDATTLQASIGRVTALGNPATATGPSLWEWEGVTHQSPVSQWNESPVQVIDTPKGVNLRDAAQGASLWRFTVHSFGTAVHALETLDRYASGQMDRKVQSRIIRDRRGQETSRTNYFETFLQRYRFPVLDKASPAMPVEQMSFIAHMVEDDPGGRRFTGPPNSIWDPLTTNRFRLEISGINLPDADVIAVTLGDASTDMVSSGMFQGKAGLLPARVRWEDITIITRAGQPQMQQWLEAQRPIAQPTDLSLIALGVDGQERIRFNAYEVVPQRIDNRPDGTQALTAKVAVVQLVNGTAGVPEVGWPADWEWAGVNVPNPLLARADRPVSAILNSAGALQITPTTPGEANFVELKTHSMGVSGDIHEALERHRLGHFERRDHSFIDRDAELNETARRNFFETFISRYRYPSFDRRVEKLVSEHTTLLAHRAEGDPGGVLVQGSVPLTMQPMLTRNFQLEVSGPGAAVPDNSITSVAIAPIRVSRVYTGTYGEKPSFAPGSVRYGPVTFTSQDPDVLRNWYEQGRNAEPRAATVRMLSTSGSELGMITLVGLRPQRYTPTTTNGGLHTLVVSVERIEQSGGSPGIPEVGAPNEWEWEGIYTFSPLLNWQEGPLSASQNNTEDLWGFSAHTIGINRAFTDLTDDYRVGNINLKSHSRIERNVQGQEIARVNYHESWLSAVHFPVFDRRELKLATQRTRARSPVRRECRWRLDHAWRRLCGAGSVAEQSVRGRDQRHQPAATGHRTGASGLKPSALDPHRTPSSGQITSPQPASTSAPLKWWYGIQRRFEIG